MSLPTKNQANSDMLSLETASFGWLNIWFVHVSLSPSLSLSLTLSQSFNTRAEPTPVSVLWAQSVFFERLHWWHFPWHFLSLCLARVFVSRSLSLVPALSPLSSQLKWLGLLMNYLHSVDIVITPPEGDRVGVWDLSDSCFFLARISP